MHVNTAKRKELLSLPVRDWDADGVYDSLLIVPSGRKHDSGWALMTIIGCRRSEPVEIAAYCDDINWKVPEADGVLTRHASGRISYHGRLRTDMGYPSGIVHMWGNDIEFSVGHSLSSTDVVVKNKVRAYALDINLRKKTNVELWKRIPEFKDAYVVSTHGRVRSLRRSFLDRWGNENVVHPRMVKSHVDPFGRERLSLVRRGKGINRQVHRLVASAFIPASPGRLFVNHKDGNPLNNHVSNLEWCTHQENMHHAVVMGLIRRGERCPSAKLSETDVFEIFALSKNGWMQKDIAELKRVSAPTISAILLGKKWSHLHPNKQKKEGK